MRNKNSTKYRYGNFGNLRQHYAEARRGFPQDIIDWFRSFMKNKKARILDLGCGTGISTRQIAESGGVVMGCDIDEQMISEAKKADDGLEYLVAGAENLPFNNSVFDAITTFSAFHWFTNAKALSEIKRTLKTDGIFFVVNKNDAGDFKKRYKEIIKSVLQQDLPEAKKGYEPERLLKESGLKNVQVKSFETSEYFNPEQAIQYLQSVSIWNLVPDDMKPTTLKLLEDYCQEKTVDGKVERKLNIKCVAGRV
ncbi:MAG: class I SAM-dependent methyltransferase [Candidatus Niyogibacteria bacterium]|nr:class I SAM-dependent methyltransferase [Candidatus Niyogibacteria bacterium]